jgi:hypothetical protein
MSRNARTPTPRGRRIALSFGAAASAVIAASISMGTAPVAGADVLDADPVSDLIGAFDPHAVSAAGVPDADPVSDLIGASDPHAVSAAGVPNTDAASHLIGALDPHAFSSTGAPTDALGLLGYGLDTYLLGPTGLDPLLAPLVDDLVGTGTVGSSPPPFTDAVSELIAAFDPNAFSSSGAPTDAFGLLGYGLDTYLLGPTGIDNLLAPLVADLLASLPSSAASVLDADPVSDLIGALDPSAFSAVGLPDGVLGDLAAGLDADLMAPTAVGAVLDPVIDGLLNSGLSLF